MLTSLAINQGPTTDGGCGPTNGVWGGHSAQNKNSPADRRMPWATMVRVSGELLIYTWAEIRG